MVVYILSLPSLILGVWECDIVQAVVDYASEVKWSLDCVCCTMLHMR